MTNKELETKLNELIARVEKLENKDSEKITLEEFFASDKDLAIHCDTEEKANKLLCAFDRMGRTWCSGESYLIQNNFNEYGKDICYTNSGNYGYVKFYKDCDYKIYEFEDIILPEEPKWQFTENEKKLLSLVDEKYKWIARDEDNLIYLYINKPVKRGNCWSVEMVNDLFIFEFEFIKLFNVFLDCIKWTDTEPCEFRKYI